ncbi:hypothetical protein I6F15_27675 [Bradyrhizobium sp. BRP14]|nr:hypothetical protein [Bradyrhizobium sp. BRP14]
MEAEDFEYPASAVPAAIGADMLWVHIGLRRLYAVTGADTNAGTVDAKVPGAMSHGVVVNHGGEVVDAVALDETLSSGKIAHAAKQLI